MIELLLEQAADPTREEHFPKELSGHVAAVKASAGVADRRQVARIEAVVRAKPETSFHFDAAGTGTLRIPDASIPAGRFATPSIGTLRQQAAAARQGGARGRVRLWVLDGVSPATD